MTQCRKILENGLRCSNPAVPGTQYCRAHRRIQFRKISGAPSPPGAPSPALWPIQPGPLKNGPVFPGLQLDKRGILVADRGVIFLPGSTEGETNKDAEQSLGLLLAELSREMPLDRHVRVAAADNGFLVWVTPSPDSGEPLSRFYDIASFAADLNRGRLFIGTQTVLIRYRNSAAPRGYDAEPIPRTEKGRVCLADTRSTRFFSTPDLTPVPLAGLLLKIRASRDPDAEPPRTALAMAAMPLYRMVARYLHAHHLGYELARFNGPEGGDLVLFEISPRPHARIKEAVPAFVLSFIADLPRCGVYTETGKGPKWRMLTQWRHRYPCLPENVAGAFGKEGLWIVSGSGGGPNLHVSPMPVFFQGDDLLTLSLSRTAPAKVNPVAHTRGLPFDLPVRLVPNTTGPTPPTAALVLEPGQTRWVRGLFYRLPVQVFQNLKMCAGKEYSILLGEGVSLDLIPFGIPMQRFLDSPLFLPLRKQLKPRVTWQLLADALNLKEDTCTFLTGEFRLDAGLDAFVPLADALGTDPSQNRIDLRIQPDPHAPVPDWEPPEDPREAEPGQPPYSGENPREHTPPEKAGRPGEESGRSTDYEASGTGPQIRAESPGPRTGSMKKDAARLYETGDFLGAAVCYALAGEPLEAARCYRKAAKKVKAGDELRQTFRHPGAHEG